MTCAWGGDIFEFATINLYQQWINYAKLQKAGKKCIPFGAHISTLVCEYPNSHLMVTSSCVVFGRYRMFLLLVDPHHGAEQDRGEQPILHAAAGDWSQSAPASRHQWASLHLNSVWLRFGWVIQGIRRWKVAGNWQRSTFCPRYKQKFVCGGTAVVMLTVVTDNSHVYHGLKNYTKSYTQN